MRKQPWTVLLTTIGLILLLPMSSFADTEKPTKTTMLSAYVGPSIAYVLVTYTATVYDPFNKQYVPTKGDGVEPKVFTRTSACTGFFVNSKGYVSTAGHCVDAKEMTEGFKADAAEWALESGYLADTTVEALVTNQGFQVESATEDRRNADRASIDVAWGTENDQQYKARLINFQRADKGDAALLKIDADNLLAIKLADSGDLEVGTEVVSIGYPDKVDQAVDADFSPSYKDGEISSRNTQSDGLFTVFEVSSALSAGMSGGPTATLDGDVVGFNSFIAADEESGGSEQFGFIGTSDRILEQINDAGVKNNIGPLGRDYHAGLDAYFAGDKEEAVTSLQAVVDEGRNVEMAQTYLTRAKKLPDPFPLGMVIGIAAGVLVLLAVAVFILLRGRKGKGGDHGGPSGGPGTTTATTPAAPSPEEGALSPQPAAVSTMVMGVGEPVQRPSGFQPTRAVDPKLETQDQVVQVEAPGGHFCSSCGTPTGPDARFCQTCGTQLRS